MTKDESEKAKQGDRPHWLTVALAITTIIGTGTGVVIGARTTSAATVSAANVSASAAAERDSSEFVRNQQQAAYSAVLIHEAAAESAELDCIYYGTGASSLNGQTKSAYALLSAEVKALGQANATVGLIGTTEAGNDGTALVKATRAILTDCSGAVAISSSNVAGKKPDTTKFMKDFNAHSDAQDKALGAFQYQSRLDLKAPGG